MIHEEQRILISQYIDAELDLESEQKVFMHIAECISCREFMRHSLRLRADLGKEPVIVPEFAEQHSQVTGGPSKRRWIIGAITQLLNKKLSVSFAFSLLLATTAIVLGILIGSMQQLSVGTSEREANERVYISVLPNVTVVGYLHRSPHQGVKQ